MASDPSAQGELAKQRRELAKIKKDLDEREAEVFERENRLDSGQHELQLEVQLLDGKLEGKKAALTALNQQIQERDQSKEATLRELNHKIALATSEAEASTKLARARGDELATQVSRVKGIQLRIKELKAEEAERKAYLKDHERQVEEIAQAGEETLASLNREIGTFTRDKEALLTDINDYRVSLIELGEQKIEAQEQLTLLRERYEISVGKYRAELTSIRDEVEDLLERKKSIDVDITARQEALTAKDHELSVRQDVLTKQAEELEGERRRLESKKALYGVI